MVHHASHKPMEYLPRGAPVAFLDGTGNPRIIEKTRPGTRIVEIKVKRNATIVQVRDTALSATRLKANNDNLDARIAELTLRMVERHGPAGMLIGPKPFRSTATSKRLYSSSLVTAHYGALRGLNSGERQDWLIQIGRNEPPAWAIEKQARAWFSDEPDFTPGTVHRTTTLLHDKAGRTTPVTVTAFTDPYMPDIVGAGP